MARPRQGRAWIGTSGYDYPHWRETFYPRELARKRWLDYAARHFNSIELSRARRSGSGAPHWGLTAPQTPRDARRR